MKGQMTLPKLNIPHETFEVITPQTKLHIVVRSMTTGEEKELKQMLSRKLFYYTVPRKLNELIYTCIEDKKPPYDTFSNFLKAITPNDRLALLYGIYEVSYGSEREFNVVCSNPVCEEEYTVKKNISDLVDVYLYDGKTPLLSKTVKVKLPVTKFTALVRQYTLYEEAELLETLRVNKVKKLDDEMEFLLYVKSMTVTTDKGELTYENILDLRNIYDQLPTKDRKALTDAVSENFTKYRMDMVVKSICPACGEENETFINIIAELFRSIRE